LKRFIKNLFSNMPIIYITLTPTLSVCNECSSKLVGELESAPTPENAKNAINLLKAHFMEEENIFFPQIMGLEPELGEEGD